jgi:ABC-2 type transport system permease protein
MTSVQRTADTPLGLAAGSLCRRELVRFLRQRSRVTAALGTPLLMWLFIGAGLQRSFQPPGAANGEGYMTYFFPGTLLLVVLFTAVFSTISIIEDRHAGFLQGVLAAPVSRGAIVLGKVLGGTILSLGQGALFLLLAPLAGIPLTPAGVLGALAVLFILAFALTGLGFVIAWRMDSVSGFHGVMNLLLLPMWMLSGAVFPLSGAHRWLGWLVRANPLSYGVSSLRQALGSRLDALAPNAVCLAVSVAFAGAMYLAAAAGVRSVSQRAA